MQNEKALKWITSSDTGISSEAIWAVMMGVPSKDDYRHNYPSDPSDFGRCYRLLNLIPEWKSRLSEVADEYGGVWTIYIKNWDTMINLWEEEKPSGSCPKLYKFMKGLQFKEDVEEQFKEEGS